MNLQSLVPPQIKLAAGILMVLAVLSGAGYIHHKIDAAGYQRCKQEVVAADDAAKAKAEDNLNKVDKHYAPKIKDLQEAQDTDAPVGPLVTRAIDGL